MKKELIFLFLFLFCLPVLYGQSKREQRFLDNWSFKSFDEPVDANDPEFPVGEWENVTLPHSWVTETKYRKLVHENAWYRNTFKISGDLGARRVYIFFERASINATVYVNGKFAGNHKGPVTSFIFDITGLTKAGKENLISVKVDNSQDLQSMPANFFGGILGRVKLITTGEIHIDPLFYASSGCFIEPIEVDQKTVKFKVISRIRNTTEEEQHIIIKNTLFKDKRIICRNDKKIYLKPNYTDVGEIKMQFEDPVLWSPEEPSLYEMKTQIYRGKELLDEIIQVTGFRNFRITSDNFWLNRKPLKLYGVNYTHPSNEKEGAAITDRSIRADLDDMKHELGINTVRFAHWPFPKAAYEHADSIGLVVMTENGYAWHEEIEIGTEGERLTKEMVYQNFNHPSILFWSSGNENPHKGYEYYAKAIREADSSRIIVCVDDKNDFILRGELNIPFKNHDAVFQNKYTGWYDGPPWNFDIFTRIIHLIGETGAGSLRTNHQPYDAVSFERSGFEPEEWAQIVCETIFQTSFINHPEQVDALYIWHYRDVFSGKYKG
ncbi:MAG: glycoside hydrolase family 2 protein, partial [Bacteroidota bacterium]